MDDAQLEKRFRNFGAAIASLDEPVGFDKLSEDVRQAIAALQIKVYDLEFEAKFTRVGTLIALVLLAERVWVRFFS